MGLIERAIGDAQASAARHGLRLLLGVAAALVGTGSDALAGALPPGRDLVSVRRWLLEHNPELRAMRAEIDAADARVIAAGALPDPQFVIELEGIDRGHPSPLPANVASTTYSLKQTLPLGGKRRLAAAIAVQHSVAIAADRSTAARRLLAAAEHAYVRYWHAGEGLKAVQRRIDLLDQVEAVAHARYALGMAAQQDSIRAQVERSVMQREQIERAAAAQEAVVGLNAVLGRPPLAALTLPAGAPLIAPGVETLDAGLRSLDALRHPALVAGSALAQAADTASELQRRNRWPDLTVGVGVMQSGARVDGYRVMLEVEIPFQRAARSARESEANAMADAARWRVDALRIDLAGQLSARWVQWDSAGAQRRLLERSLLPLAQANFESAMASYQVAAVDFASVLEALDAWQGAELALIDLQRDQLLAAVAIRSVLGDTP